MIISSKLTEKEKTSLLRVLEKRKGVIAWKMSDIKGISLSFCTHKILMEESFKPVIQPQRRLNPKVQDVVKDDIVRLLDSGLIYPISDSPWVSPTHVIPEKGGITVVLNDNNELIPSRTVTGWRVCIDYRKLNEATILPNPNRTRRSSEDNLHLSLWDFFLQEDAVRIMQRSDNFLKLNNDKAKGTEKPWLENRVPYQLCDHICEPYRFKNKGTKWPTYTSDIDGFCNGGELPGMVQVGSMTYIQDHMWYDELADGKMKDETLALKAKIEGSWEDATPRVIKFCRWLKRCFENFHELEYEVLVKLQVYWQKVNVHEIALFTRMENFRRGPYANMKTEWASNPYLNVNRVFERDYEASNVGCTQENQGHKGDLIPEPSNCKVRRFEMMKYSFDDDENNMAYPKDLAETMGPCIKGRGQGSGALKFALILSVLITTQHSLNSFDLLFIKLLFPSDPSSFLQCCTREDLLSSSVEDEKEYAMAVKEFINSSRDEEDLCGDPNHLIGECLKPSKNNDQRAFIGGAWSDYEEDEVEKTKDETCLIAQAPDEICLGINLEPNEWIKDSGCSKHMTDNQKLFSSYKAYNGGNVIFRSNLHGKIIGKVEESLNVTFDETPPPPKTSPLEDDELVEEEAIKGSGIKTIAYADSDHAGDYVDRKSTSGVCTFMGCCLTSWFFKKQTALAISITEAEYVSAGKACQQALWMKQTLIDYGIRLDDIPIMCDNKGAIDLSKNPIQHSRTKHIEIRHHFLRDNVQKGNISIEKVSSEDNIADILTKPLKREPFNYLRLGLGMMEQID
ncbi:hypothetical protein Tco_0803432 [Tanacetum coccineum]|uniref:Retrovirus-related Pol polyprotein from transposon TNT 1-94-like beta-barrel domain-containing protein n=1 Tax=Tanacetum coccineum TaxID=301880 RepID=A0ABQ5A1M2_9ASTR